ncbi:MAG TPA: hypothetical protein VE263_13525 [Candidatus Angelobacter sp.]|nr:hypothetical protein [Candidatus Angelobacter sp.]
MNRRSSGRGGVLEQQNKIPRKGQWQSWVVLPFFLVWCAMMLLTAYRNVEAWRTRSAIRELLRAPDAEYAVMVNGQPGPNAGAVLGAIRGVHLRMSHHTYPNHEIPVVIRRKHDVLELTLGRDSGLPHEYWIFWTREKGNPNRLEIGRIETSVFDGQ